MVTQQTHQEALKKVEAEIWTNKKIDFKATLIDDAKELKRVLSTLKEDTIVAFDTETTGLDYENDSLVGFSFCFNEDEAYYVPIAHFYLGVGEQVSHEEAKIAIKKIFNSRVVGHNIKFDLHFVTRFLGEVELDIFADSMILAWLINPESALSLDKLSEKLLEHKMIAFKDSVKKGETFASVALEDACDYAAEDAYITLRLYYLFLEMLRDQGRSIL